MQLQLPFGPVVNREFLSNHWLEHRLPMEPEWTELEQKAKQAAERLISLWQKEKTRAPLYGDEAGLEEKFIQPVFEILGWHTKYQAFLQGREPDYALFASEAALDEALVKGRHNPDFWLHASVVADSKAWHVSLDRPQKLGSKREYPPEQIEWYLDRSRCDFGILTNGRIWRLVPRDIGRNRPRFQTYLEVDLPALLDLIAPPSAQLQFEVHGKELEVFLRFFLLFGAHGYSETTARRSLIRRAVEGSSEHSQGVSEALKDRVFESLRLSIEGFIALKANGLDPGRHLSVCRSEGLVFLYRLLFILFAEDRGFLPYQKNDVYTRNRSLARFRIEVAAKIDLIERGLDKAGFSRVSTDLWQELKSLFDIIDSGNKRYQVPSYNGGLFNAEEHPFLEQNALSDHYVALILDQLSRAPHRDRPGLGLFRVDYRDLAIQQLGSVYEGLLELHPRYASQDMAVIRARGAGEKTELIVSALEAVPRGFERTDILYPLGSVYLQTDKGERRAFGSYYTPDHIVNHIVEATLGRACREIHEVLEREIKATDARIMAGAGDQAALEAQRRELGGAFADRVLKLRVLDPAMGSGHFLIRACQYLAEEIATNPNTADSLAEAAADEGATILYWKRRVVENCLFGADVNPMAVELAKLALWLETVAVDAPLAFLDHHLQAGDSLIGASIAKLDTLPGAALISGIFGEEIEAAIPSLLKPLVEIHDLRSSSLDEVKKKEAAFKKKFQTARAPFEAVADVWCAVATGLANRDAAGEGYGGVIETLCNRRNLASNSLVSSARAALEAAEITPLHWELAFPEVFLGQDGGQRGFDAIIGNPPYDVLSERESGPRVARLQSFVDHNPNLFPSKVGKNNLYKLFICRAFELAREGGVISFIVPMPLLGDEQARGVRQLLLQRGAFTELHAFPQKDNPNRRVFKDAKLSTALFVYVKGSVALTAAVPFPSTRHPANRIEENSPTLTVRTEDIALYDPLNSTIVSCGQEDWDLAVRIARRPSIRRLGTLCKSYQGEVNETTDKRFLNDQPTRGNPLMLRGANICMYALRSASQGEPKYLDVAAYQRAKEGSEKAFHSRADRIGFQRSAPQNNYRRVIAARIPAGEFCFDTVSYIPTASSTMVDFDFLLALLNSKLIDWYFTIGSTNSKINEYQFNNFPCPTFAPWDAADEKIWKCVASVIDEQPEAVDAILEKAFVKTPYSPSIERAIIHLSRRVQSAEAGRGKVSRADRAHLDITAQPYQDAIDRLLFRIVGFGEGEVRGLEDRLSSMS